jgi:hypothetical protein
VTEAPSPAGDQLVVSEPAGPGARFYRLVSDNPDTNPPKVVWVNPGDGGDRLTLEFSEPVDGSSATNLVNYYLADSQFNLMCTVDAILTTPQSVDLLIDPPLMDGASYYLGVERVKDLAGNVMFPITMVFTNPVPATTPPTLVTVTPDPAGNRITLTFSEPVDPLCATDLFDYYLADDSSNQLFPIQAILSAPDSVDLILDPPLVFGGSYFLRVAGVLDLAGNVNVPGGVYFTAP